MLSRCRFSLAISLMPLLGLVPWPLAVAINRLSPRLAERWDTSYCGNKTQSFGREGKEISCFVSDALSKTATAFNEESATKRRVPSADCARAVG